MQNIKRGGRARQCLPELNETKFDAHLRNTVWKNILTQHTARTGERGRLTQPEIKIPSLSESMSFGNVLAAGTLSWIECHFCFLCCIRQQLQVVLQCSCMSFEGARHAARSMTAALLEFITKCLSFTLDMTCHLHPTSRLSAAGMHRAPPSSPVALHRPGFFRRRTPPPPHPSACATQHSLVICQLCAWDR